MHHISFISDINICSRIKNFIIFSAVFTVFFLYRKAFVYDNYLLLFLVHTLILVVFIVSIYKIKYGLFIFIFFIPLLNSVTTIIGVHNTNIILFLFFSLFLGFIVNRFVNSYDKNYKETGKAFIFDLEITKAIILFIIIFTVSAIIIIYRYSNFFPLVTNNYYDLIVNINGVKSTGSIFWTLRFFFNYIIGFGLFFVIFNILEENKDIIGAILAIIFSNIVVIVFGIYQYFINPYLGNFRQWVEAGRINATFTDPNSLGNYIVLLFPIFLMLIFYFKKWYIKVLSVLLFISFTAIAFLSGSRNAFIGMAVTLLIFLLIALIKLIRTIIRKIRSIRKGPKTIMLVILICAIVIMILIVPLLSSCSNLKELKDMYRPPKTNIALIDRMVDTVWMYVNNLRISRSPVEAFKSVSSYRGRLWIQAINMFKDYPVTGVGQGAYIIELPNYYSVSTEDIRHVDFSGNYYLQILSELGLPGLFLILFIFFVIIKKVFIYYRNHRYLKRIDRQDWLLAGFFVSFISMVIVLFLGPHTNFNEIQFSFWLIIGLMIAYIKIREGGTLNESYNKSDLIKKKSNRESLNIVSKIRLNMYQYISLGAIILVFGGVFFASSWRHLSINVEQNVYGWENNYGFYNEEVLEDREVRWIAQDASEVIKKEGSKMVIPIKAYMPLINKIPVFIRFYSDNALLKIIMLRDDLWHDIELNLPYTGREKFTFTMAVSRSWIPKQWGISSDTRELSVIVGEVEFMD